MICLASDTDALQPMDLWLDHLAFRYATLGMQSDLLYYDLHHASL